MKIANDDVNKKYEIRNIHEKSFILIRKSINTIIKIKQKLTIKIAKAITHPMATIIDKKVCIFILFAQSNKFMNILSYKN